MLLPKLIGHLWRPLHPIDANALRHLIEECAFLDGFTAPARERTLEHIETDTLAAVDNTGKIAAFAWLERQSTAHEFRVILDGRVHPDYRGKGLGRFLLTWSEQRAQAIIAAQDAPAVTRIVFYDRDADAPRLYERFGFRFLFAEEEYRYALTQPIPNADLRGATLHQWSAATASQFYSVYVAAFRQRPNFPNWSQDIWVENFTGDDTFRADLSVLLMLQGTPIGYALCHDAAPNGVEIVQLGIADTVQRQGWGRVLLTHVLGQLQSGGFEYAELSVNVNNPQATALYVALGFVKQRRYSVYVKP